MRPGSILGVEGGGGGRARRRWAGSPLPDLGSVQPQPWLWGADPHLASFSILPESPASASLFLDLTCVSSRVTVRASSFWTSPRRDGEDVAASHLGGRCPGPRPRERGPQPATARAELTGLQIDARLGFTSN